MNGEGVTIAGVLSPQPEVAIPGFLVMVNGGATAYDGVSVIQTAQDAKERESIYTEVAGAVGAKTGELSSFGLTFNGHLKATRNCCTA